MPISLGACSSSAGTAAESNDAGQAGPDVGSSAQGDDSGSSPSSTDDGGGSTGSNGSGGPTPGQDAGGNALGAEAGQGSSADASYLPTVDAGAPAPIGDQTLPRKLYIENHCTETIWTFALPHTTFPNAVPLQIAAGQAFVVGWPNTWSGRIWGRTQCTGSGYGNIKCAQTGNDTLAEFTLTAGMSSDWYDISLVDGFTIPTGILQLDAPWKPSPTYVPGGKLGADGNCGSPICAENLLTNCPASQRKTDSAGMVVTCVNGQNPGPIQQYFKAGCPTSYSWPYDDPQSLFICPDFAQNNGVGSKDYKVIFCPTQGSTPGFP